MNAILRQSSQDALGTASYGFNDTLAVFSGGWRKPTAAVFQEHRFTPMPHKRGGLLTNAPMQYRNNPEQAISCEDREGNGKCGALSRTTPCRLARTGAKSSQACRSQADGAFSPLRVGMFRLQPYGVEFPFLPAVQKYPNNTAISGGTPQRRCPWYDSPGSLATETGQWSEALPLNSGETAEKEHTLAGCPSDRVLTKALGEQSPGTAEKINRTLSGNSLLLTAEYPDVCTRPEHWTVTGFRGLL